MSKQTRTMQMRDDRHSIRSSLLQYRRTTATLLYESSNKRNKKSKGVYVRPSAAIERGSGFFFPGLEGSRIRLFFGLAILILVHVNHKQQPQREVLDVGTFSDRIAIVYGILLLLQAAVEYVGENRNPNVESPPPIVDGSNYNPNPNETEEAVTWAATSYVKLTPATHFLLLVQNDTANGEVLYGVGAYNYVKEGIQSAMDTVHNQSKGGRVAIPLNHPAASKLFPKTLNEEIRCVILQRIVGPAEDEERRMCLVVASDQLLPSFTKNDLKWLGQLANYLGTHTYPFLKETNEQMT